MWIDALQNSTMDNFKEHDMVKRMLSEDIKFPVKLRPNLSLEDTELIAKINQIGRSSNGITDVCWRMVYYADLVLRREPFSLVEIGAGVGEFYAIVRALGYQGNYWIFDLPEVQEFQAEYLLEVQRRTGLKMLPFRLEYEFCISFYALGEFDDEVKTEYIENVVKRCPRGMIAWNPHSGASSEMPFDCEVMDQYDGSKLLLW